MTENTKHHLKFFGICGFHAMFVLIGTLLLLNMSYTGGAEISLFQMISGINNFVLHSQETPDPSDFLFINTAYDRALTEKYDADGIPLGNQDITDRRKLARLFAILNQAPEYRAILCDLLFETPSSHDDELLAAMQQTPRLVIASHKDADSKVRPLLFPIRHGVVDYITADADGMFLKFALQHGSDKTMPLMLYENLHKAQFHKGRLFSTLNGKLSLNAFMLNFRIRDYHLRDEDSFAPYVMSLGELLQLPNEAIWQTVKARILTIGYFAGDSDRHKTVYGDMPGALIQLNAYLALLNHDPVLSPYFLLFLFVVYVLISYHLFSGHPASQWPVVAWLLIGFNKLEAILKKRRIIGIVLQDAAFGELVSDWFSYAVVMTLISIGFSMFFNLHLNILFIATWFTVVDALLRWRQKLRRHKELT